MDLGPRTDQRFTVRKRNRRPQSCNHCRIRKSKCDRAKPCLGCVKSGDAATCSYVSSRSSLSSEGKLSSDEPSRSELVSRIDRLEQLVLSAMSNQPQSALPSNEMSHIDTMPSGNSGDSIPRRDTNAAQKVESDPDVDQLSKAFWVMKVEHHQVTYLGGTYWVSVMSEIKEYRDFLDTNHEALEQDAIDYQASARSLGLLRGVPPPNILDRLVSQIPTRPIADKLIARYFGHCTSLWPIIHEPTFRKQYNQHWIDPRKTKMTWLALLFGIFNLAVVSYEETEGSTVALDRSWGGTYKTAEIDCLIASDFAHNPGEHTIESLILYVQAEWVNSQDALIEISVVIGMIIRLAMRMGIHRDSKAHPTITPFRAEMRRRTWSVIQTMDIVYSFWISLPAVIHPGEYDCALPKNVCDVDFDEYTAKLPPSRPSTEVTEVSYLVINNRLLLVLQEILSLTESSKSMSIQDVLKYEQELDNVWRAVPSHFRLSLGGELTGVPLSLKRMRINLDRTYQMAQCVLHRKFIRSDSAYIQYRRSSIDAALILLNHQATIYLDCDSAPAIYPQSSRKRHFVTLMTHDFVIACMTIALDLHYGFESHPFTPRPDDIALWGYDRRHDLITALQTSTEFWRMSRGESIEAAKAYGLFSLVLEKVKQFQPLTQASLGINLALDDPPNSSETVATNVPSYTKGSDLPPEFDLNMWNSWKDGGDDLETLSQWFLENSEFEG